MKTAIILLLIVFSLFLTLKYNLAIDKEVQQNKKCEDVIRSDRDKIETLEARFNDFKYYWDDTRDRVNLYLPKINR